MGFLRRKDYQVQIALDKLDQIANAEEERVQAETAAIREASNYLRHRFDVSKIFKNIKSYKVADAYAVDDLIELKADAYAAGTLYAIDALVSEGGSVFRKLDNAPAGTATSVSASWRNIGKNEALYSCKTTASAGTDPNNTTNFTEGDTRDAQILMYIIDMTLYHLHSSVSPRQMPVNRAIRYDGNGPDQKGGAIGWLKMVSRGEIMPDLPKITPAEGEEPQGRRIRYGSATKFEHEF